MPACKQFDVLGLGCAAVDDILYVERFPRADEKMRVLRRERHCGGLTATALVAASRLGAKCAFAGTLGFDEDSEFVLETLRRERVDVRHVVRRRGAGPVRSVIIVDEQRGTRNIFASLDGVLGADALRPARTVIESSSVLLIDHFGIPGNIRAARTVRRAGGDVVADLEHSNLPRFRELMALVNHPIFSQRMATELTGEKHPRHAVAQLAARDKSVVVTCGERGAWWSESGGAPQHCPAFPVNAVDTTGCGDVFHGAYAAALAHGASMEERIRFASAAAALKATQPGGQVGIPTRAGVQKCLQRSSRGAA